MVINANASEGTLEAPSRESQEMATKVTIALGYAIVAIPWTTRTTSPTPRDRHGSERCARVNTS